MLAAHRNGASANPNGFKKTLDVVEGFLYSGCMSRLAKNTLMLTAASIGQKAIAFLYFALIARTIGEESTGSYFLALGMITTIGVLDDIGLTSVVIREVAKTPDRAKELLKNALAWKMFTMPLTVVLAFFLPTLPFFDFSPEAIMLTRIATAVMLLDTLSLTFYGVLRGLQRLSYESLGIFVGQTMTTIIGAAVLLSGAEDLRLLIVALIVGSGWNAIFAIIQVVRRLGLDALVPSFTMGTQMVRMAFMFFLAAVFVKIYSYTDSFLLNRELGEAAVGTYSVAYKLTYAFQFLPLAFIGALYPTFSAHTKDPAILKSTLLKAEWYMALLAAPIVFGIFSLAPEIISLAYSTTYIEAAQTLSILIFVLLVIFLDFPLGALLNATGRQAYKSLIMGLTMVINVVGNLVFIPILGIPGAAVAAVLSFTFMFSAGWWAVNRVIPVSLGDLLGATGGLFLAGGLMSVVVILAKTVIPWPATIPLGAAAFFLIAYGTKSITESHLTTFRKLLSRNAYADDTPTND